MRFSDPQRNRSSAGDQADWVICISWQRMLIASMSANINPTPVLRRFIDETYRLAAGSVEHLMKADLSEADAFVAEGDYYRACLVMLEARAAYEGDEGPTRLNERAGLALCRCFREVFPTAPPGFEHVGRGGKSP